MTQIIITGTAGNDILDGDRTGANEADAIYGLPGNDILSGLGGSDTLFGEQGDDQLFGGNGTDYLHGGDNNDILFGAGNTDYLYGNSGNDVIYGVDGIDELRGGDHNDQLFGGTDNDYMYGDNNEDRLDGESGDDILYGGRDNDYLSGGEGRDLVFGEEGNDWLIGTVSGSGDHLAGGSGNDTYEISSSTALLDSIEELANGGIDTLQVNLTLDLRQWPEIENLTTSRDGFGNIKRNVMTGSSSPNILFGRANEDTLYGGGGNDGLNGGADNDYLCGVNPSVSQPGKYEVDKLTGDTGNDVFVLGDGNRSYYNEPPAVTIGPESHALITDFMIGIDKIYLKNGIYTLLPYISVDFYGTAIYIDSSVSGRELIGIVQNIQPQQLNLSNTEQFVYL